MCVCDGNQIIIEIRNEKISEHVHMFLLYEEIKYLFIIFHRRSIFSIFFYSQFHISFHVISYTESYKSSVARRRKKKCVYSVKCYTFSNFPINRIRKSTICIYACTTNLCEWKKRGLYSTIHTDKKKILSI